MNVSLFDTKMSKHEIGLLLIVRVEWYGNKANDKLNVVKMMMNETNVSRSESVQKRCCITGLRFEFLHGLRVKISSIFSDFSFIHFTSVSCQFGVKQCVF